jgi:hypothetical protein
MNINKIINKCLNGLFIWIYYRVNNNLDTKVIKNYLFSKYIKVKLTFSNNRQRYAWSFFFLAQSGINDRATDVRHLQH